MTDIINMNINRDKTTSLVAFLGLAQKILFINSILGGFKVDKIVKITP